MGQEDMTVWTFGDCRKGNIPTACDRVIDYEKG